MTGAPQPEISVVMPVLDGASTIDAQLGALATQTYSGSWELVIADNGSADGTLARVDRWRPYLPSVRVVDASERRGISFARNTGIKASRAMTWVCCDADDVVSPEWLAAMASALEEHPFVGGALDNRTLNRMNGFRGHADSTGPATSSFLPYAIGCNMGATREVFERVGGFDEQFVGGGDDVDFSWRVQLAGVPLHHAPDAVIAYRHRAQTRAALRQLHTYARAEPRLYRRFRERGMPPPALGRVLKQYGWLVTRLPLLVLPGPHRRTWLRVAAKRLGRLRGSLAIRVFYP